MTTQRIPTTKSIFQQVSAIQGQSRVRLLTESDCAEARRAFQAFLRYCEKNGFANPSLLMDSGAVANSYGYRADATKLSLDIGLSNLDGEGNPTPETQRFVRVVVTRGWARQCPGGDYGMLRLSIDKPDDGRKWTERPPFRFSGRTYRFNNAGNMYIK